MNIKSSMISVGIFAGALGIFGGAVGGILGWLVPGYYRQVFSLRDEVNPIELGIGLGVTQGLTWGLVVGLLIVAVIAWKETRVAGR